MGYKVIWQKVILGLRYPEFNWFQVSYITLSGFIFALIFGALKQHSIGALILAQEKKSLTAVQKYFIFLLIAFSLITGVIISETSLIDLLSADGVNAAGSLFGQLLNPEFAIFEQALFAAIETIYMALMATFLAIIPAFVLSFLGAYNLMQSSFSNKLIYNLVRFIMNFSRSVEPLIWAIIFSVWVGIGPFAGMLALFLHSVVSLAKLYSEQIENISDGPVEAITATGASPLQVIWYGVVPQIIIPFLSFTIYRWDINVRMATIIGMVGGGGIGTLLIQYQGQALWNEVGMIVIVIAVIVWILDFLSAKIREAVK